MLGPPTFPLRNLGVLVRIAEPPSCELWRWNMDFTGFLDGSGWLQPALWGAVGAVIIVLPRASNVFRYIPNNQVIDRARHAL